MTIQTSESMVAEQPTNEETVGTSAIEAKQVQHNITADTDDDDDSMDDEVNDDDEMSSEDFEALLNESEDRTRMSVSAGQKVEGRIVALSGHVAYVDIGMRSEASLEMPDDPRFAELKEGDVLPVFITNPSGQVQVSLDPLMGKGDISILEEAYANKQDVEGKVVSQINGGYEVNATAVRCFCPHSQMNLRGGKEGEELIGETMMFRIIDLDARKKNVVLSRRIILEEARKEEMAEIRAKLSIGTVMTGTVRDIQRFGAFVDLGGIQGLLHISQLSYQNVERVESLLSVGDEVEVKVLEITTDARGKERISLSMKALQTNPWDSLNLSEGQLVTGKVARKSQFGVFVNLAPAIDGLLPRRMMKKAGQHINIESFTEGEEIEVEVIEVNLTDRKIALALPGWNEEIKSELRQGDILKAEVIKILPVGVLVKGLEDPARGLLHKRNLKHGTPKQISDAYPVGSQLEVVLQEIDSQGRFNFVLPNSGDEVDAGTITAFSGKSDLGHSPFASFFTERD